METRTRITCTPKEADYIFESGSYDHPEVPLFGFSVKSIETENTDRDNSPRSYSAIIRHPDEMTVRKEYGSLTEFLGHVRRNRTVTEKRCVLTEAEKKLHGFERFLNGTAMTDRKLKANIMNYRPHEHW